MVIIKYKIVYFEDEFSSIAETIVECDDESKLGEMADMYCEENLKHLNVAGAKWYKIDD